MKITAVIVAGGKGTRMGADKNKVFLKILGREVLYYTISAFEKNDKIDDIIVVTGKNDIESIFNSPFTKTACSCSSPDWINANRRCVNPDPCKQFIN